MRTSSVLARIAVFALGALMLVAAPGLAQTGSGGPSTGIGESNGGDGGSSTVDVNPTAQTGNSGDATAGSSSTNTGDTGAATSSAQSAPTATSGQSGDTGATGDVSSEPTARNDVPLGSARAGVAPAQIPADALPAPAPAPSGAAIPPAAALPAVVEPGEAQVVSSSAAAPAVAAQPPADSGLDGSPVGYNTPLSKRANRAATMVLLALAGLAVALRIRSRMAVPAYAAS